MFGSKTLTRLAVAAVLAVAPLAGAALPDPAGGLLTTADLPAGYGPYEHTYQPYTASTAPACSRTLDELDFSTPRFRGVEYARAVFAKGRFGPWVVENLRRYPSTGTADRDLTRILGVLRTCPRFQQSYGNPGAVMTVTITPIAMRSVGDRGKSLWITVGVNGTWAYGEIMTLARVRGTLMVLDQLGFRPPDAEAAQALAARAAAKARKVAGP